MTAVKWAYLIIASISEVWWTYSLKYIDLKRIFATPVKHYFVDAGNLKLLAPVGGYILFGVGNIIFFSMAMKGIPTSVAFTAWMAISIVGLKLMDVFVFKASSFNYMDILFYALIIVGIVGLRRGMTA